MSKLTELVRGVLSIDPAAPALEFEHRWLTWEDLAATGEALEAQLAAHGLGSGVRVGMMVRNRPPVAAALLSVIGAERCIVTLNPILPDERLAADIGLLQAPVVVGLPQDWARAEVRRAAAEIGCLGLELTGDPATPIRAVPGLEQVAGADLRRDAEGVGIEMLTSGTTGVPKRIPLKARNFERMLLDAAIYEGGRDPHAPPRLRNGVQILHTSFAHIGGLWGLFTCMTAGRKACLLERFTVEGFVDAVKRHRPRVANAPPTAVRMILDAEVPKADLASLVVFRTGTAPLDPDLADAFHDRYGIPVLENYGATEFAGGVAGWTLPDYKAFGASRRGSVGRISPGIEARIVVPETGEALPYGSEGLLELRGPHLGDGQWVRTTDLAVLDAEGFLWIRGRHDNAIIRGGFKILPDDVVRALEQHPAIREACVIALADPRLGQVPAAAYILKANAAPPSEDELRAFLRERLLPYQVPVKLKAVAELPRTPSMKVSQPELRKLFERAAA